MCHQTPHSKGAPRVKPIPRSEPCPLEKCRRTPGGSRPSVLADSDSTDARWLVRGSRLRQLVPKTLRAGKRAESHQEEGPLGCRPDVRAHVLQSRMGVVQEASPDSESTAALSRSRACPELGTTSWDLLPSGSRETAVMSGSLTQDRPRGCPPRRSCVIQHLVQSTRETWAWPQVPAPEGGFLGQA